MSTVIVFIHEASPSIELIKGLRKITAKPLGEIRAALVSGTSIARFHLLENDHEEKAGNLRNLVALVSSLGVKAQAWHVESGDSSDGMGDDDLFELSGVLGLLDDYDAMRERIERMDDLKSR